MALSTVHWVSKVLDKYVAMNVLFPDVGKPPFPVFYLLHGLSDDYSVWLRRTRLEVYAAKYPLIIVTPDGFRGFYTDNEEGRAYGKYIAEELPTMVERMFPAKTSRAGRCIGGLSMGGYGAMRAALNYPDHYVSANSHSGAVMNGNKVYRGLLQRERRAVFGARPAGSNHDLLAVAKKLKDVRPAVQFPALRVDCGVDDFLLEDNRAFHAGLESLGIKHEYEEFPGSHEWGYWDLHVREALEFHAKALKLVVAS